MTLADTIALEFPRPWPAEPPVPRRMECGPLRVPLTTHPDIAVKALDSGSIVQRGQELVQNPAKSIYLPLAPCSGRIGSTVPATRTDGKQILAVELFPDASQPTAATRPEQWQRITVDRQNLVQWIAQLRSMGVYADRHDCPDLLGQLGQIVSRPIDRVVCTVLDTDPMARLNGALAAHFAAELTAGLSVVSEFTAGARPILVVENGAPPAWMNPLRSLAAGRFRIIDLPNDYPQSNPTLLAFDLFDRRLRPSELPPTAGLLVLDAAATIDIARALQGIPMLQTTVAIHDHIQRRSHFLNVPIGTGLASVLERIALPPDGIILRGGDLLGDHRINADVVIGGAELVIHITAMEKPVNPDPCIRCGWCSEACPTRLQPALILDAAQRHDPALARRAGIHACIECGLCTYVCPSHLPLLGAIRGVRQMK